MNWSLTKGVAKAHFRKSSVKWSNACNIVKFCILLLFLHYFMYRSYHFQLEVVMKYQGLAATESGEMDLMRQNRIEIFFFA